MIDITKELLSIGDEKYRTFQQRIIKVPLETIIGIKTPELKALAKQIVKYGEDEAFLAQIPHKYFEENQLHAFIISEYRDREKAAAELEIFLPYVDNWATCDQLRPKSFKKDKSALISDIHRWIASEHTYTVRFAMNMLLTHFLGDDFKPEYLEMVASVESEEYYIMMMQAWFFAEALAKQQDSAIRYFTEKRLGKWVNNKAIQKARESYRISPELKEKLLQYKM